MADFTEIIQEINTNLPDNTTQAITAAKLRTTLIDLTNAINENESAFEENIGEILIQNTKFETNQILSETSIVDNLNSDNSNDVLSSKQGKVLGDLLFGEPIYEDLTVNLSQGYYQYAPSTNRIRVNKSDVSNIKGVRIPVVPGEKFKIFGTDGSNLSAVRLWAFSDDTVVTSSSVDYYSVLSVSDNNVNTRGTGVEITAPEGSKYLTVSFHSYDATQDKIQKSVVSGGLINRVSTLELKEDVFITDKINLVGKGNTYVNDTKNQFYCLNGHTYRIYPDSVETTNWSEITYTSASYNLFSIQCYNLNNENSSYLYNRGCDTKTLPLDNYYDVTADKNGYIRISGRLNTDAEINYVIVDVTDLIGSYSWVAETNLITGYYYNTNGTTVGREALVRSDTTCAKISCKPGDTFKIVGNGNSGAIQLYTFTNGSNTVIYKPNYSINARTTGYYVTAPSNTAYLCVNLFQYDSETDAIYKLVASNDNLVKKVESLETEVNFVNNLKGKNIVVFGDSITEFKNNGKGWCDWANEISGANFINIGIGGTQIKSRVKTPHIFDETVTYNVGDYVYYLASDTHYHFYQCNTQHTGAWNASNFTEVTNSYKYAGLDMVNLITQACDTSTSIETRFADAEAASDCVKTNTTTHDDNTAQIAKLKAIDWSTINAVIIMGGTNDFPQVSFGSSDSTDNTVESGAINIIVQQLSTSYPRKSIYFVKEPVRWYPHTEGGQTVYTDPYWCDVYIPSNYNMTLMEWFNKIEEQFIINHIPVCDLYYGLGWNKFNFWSFFSITADGTHPYLGFRPIAEKIVSFIKSNKVFA